MLRLTSEQELLAAFRPKDRDKVELPGGLSFPALVRGYLAWKHPAGGRVYLVFAVPGGAPTGIVFDTNGGDATVSHLCDWCHSTGNGAEIALLTARRDARTKAGAIVCSDLGCMRKLEDEADRRGVSPVPAIERVVHRMGRFADEALGIDLSGAGR